MKPKSIGILLSLASFILITGLGIPALAIAQDNIANIYLPLVIKNYPIIETGRVVFVSYRDGNSEIYKMNYDGSDVIRLTYNSSGDMNPDWSSDGTEIAFESDRTGESEIYVMNADGMNQTQVTTMTHCYSPQWSPDGTRIAFYTWRDNANIIYTMNPDGTGLFQVTDPAMSAESPSWSPGGSKIAYLTARNTPGIYSINVNGTNPTLIYASVGIAYMAWSPDGTRFALSKSTPPDYNFDIYLYNLSTTIMTRLTTTQFNHNSVDWSPESYHVIFHSNRDDINNFEIYTMDTNGGQLTNISNNPAADDSPDWVK